MALHNIVACKKKSNGLFDFLIAPYIQQALYQASVENRVWINGNGHDPLAMKVNTVQSSKQ